MNSLNNTDPLSNLIYQVQLGAPGAYEAVMQRFQDMAVGYAYASLADWDLAEDVAQEAFIQAYYRLPELRQPAAFPGWFRRIVFTQIHRHLRQKKATTVSLEQAVDIQNASQNPAYLAERQILSDQISLAIQSLPIPQRDVTVLFYITGYTQKEISLFLEIPISTVKTRLFAARKKLHQQMINLIQDQLPQYRPSRSHSFIQEMSMNLALAFVHSCGKSGCQVKLLGDDTLIDTRYTLQMQDKIRVRPGQLVIVDQQSQPVRTVFRLYRSKVVAIEAGQIYVERNFVGWLDKVQPRYAATIAEGLSLNLKVGDEVWGRDIIFGEVEAGQPKDPEGLLNTVAPLVREIYESDTFKLEPNSAAAHTNRGNVYLDQGEYEQAIAAYNQALTINPNYVIAYINRGQAHKALGDLGQARADFTQALTCLDHPSLDIQPGNHPDLHMASLEYLSTWIGNTRRHVMAYLDELKA